MAKISAHYIFMAKKSSGLKSLDLVPLRHTYTRAKVHGFFIVSLTLQTHSVWLSLKNDKALIFMVD